MDLTTSFLDIIEGFDTDLQELAEAFKDKSLDLHLADFFDFWDEQEIDYIFANRYDPRELFDAISEMNKRLVLVAAGVKSQDFQHRVVAMYFLLCVFVKQPLEMKQKIRFSCDDAVAIRGLISECSCAQTAKDIDFAWRYLVDKDAIDIVEQRLIYGPSMLTSRGVKRRQVDESSVTDRVLEARQESADFIDTKIEPALAELESMSVSYGFIKDVLGLGSSQADPNAVNKVLDIIKIARNFVKDFRNESE